MISEMICPACNGISSVHNWVPVELFCGDCMDTHSAYKCPSCGECFDHIWDGDVYDEIDSRKKLSG